MPQFGSKKNSAKPFGLRRGVPKRSSVEGGANLNDALSGHGGRLAGSGHIAWFDYAKGICIILVVMMHSTLGVGEAFAAKGLASEGFMHWVVAYAKPFRMPDFFMLAGLFLSFAINRSWMHYLDKKVVHFAYFYVIWTIIQAAIKTAAIQGLDGAALASTFLGALINPYPTLWFIYVLPLFFVATKLLHGVPAWLMLAGAAIVHTAHPLRLERDRPIRGALLCLLPRRISAGASHLQSCGVGGAEQWSSRSSDRGVGAAQWSVCILPEPASWMVESRRTPCHLDRSWRHGSDGDRAAGEPVVEIRRSAPHPLLRGQLDRALYLLHDPDGVHPGPDCQHRRHRQYGRRILDRLVSRGDNAVDGAFGASANPAAVPLRASILGSVAVSTG